MVKCSYDAWGNPIAITDGQGNDVSNDPYDIANINPYRYRGYRYDTETSLYYLQSRYYDPEIGRFISMDDTKILMLTQGEVLGANLFAYCNNNPVMYSDPSGYYPTPEEMQLMCIRKLPNPDGFNAKDALVLRRLQISSPTGYLNYTTFQDLHKKHTGRYFKLPFQGDITCTVTSMKVTWIDRAFETGIEYGFAALVSIGSAGVASFIGGTFVVGDWISDDMGLGTYTVYKVTVKNYKTTTQKESLPGYLCGCYRMVTRMYPREYTYTFYYGPIGSSYGITLYPPTLSMKDYTRARRIGIFISQGPIVKCSGHGGGF